MTSDEAKRLAELQEVHLTLSTPHESEKCNQCRTTALITRLEAENKVLQAKQPYPAYRAHLEATKERAYDAIEALQEELVVLRAVADAAKKLERADFTTQGWYSTLSGLSESLRKLEDVQHG